MAEVNASIFVNLPANVLSLVKQILDFFATMDPAAERIVLDRYLSMASWVAIFIPALRPFLAIAKTVIDTPGDLEALQQFAKDLEALLP